MNDSRLNLPAVRRLQPEWDPLFAPGYHAATLSELRQLCVSDFPASSTREEIMTSIDLVVERLRKAGITGELWVDGSFTTRKLDPDDGDLVLRVILTRDVDEGSVQHQQALDWFEGISNALFGLDTWLVADYPPGHPEHDPFEFVLNYWIRHYGVSRRMQHKGVAMVIL